MIRAFAVKLQSRPMHMKSASNSVEHDIVVVIVYRLLNG